MRPAPIGSPSSSGPIASAWPRRPGPRQRSSSASRPRRSRIVSRPAVGSSARTSTASPAPSSRAADDVEHPVDAVAAVDVEAPGRAEHARVAPRRARGTRARRARRARTPRTRRRSRRRRPRAARSRSDRAPPRGSGAHTSARSSVTPASTARASARGASRRSAPRSRRRARSRATDRRAAPCAARALATTRRRAAQHVDHDDLIGEPALRADAPPERDAQARTPRASGCRRSARGEGTEATSTAGSGWRGVTSSTLAVRAPAAVRMATTATRPPSSSAERGQPHARPRPRV